MGHLAVRGSIATSPSDSHALLHMAHCPSQVQLPTAHVAATRLDRSCNGPHLNLAASPNLTNTPPPPHTHSNTQVSLTSNVDRECGATMYLVLFSVLLQFCEYVAVCACVRVSEAHVIGSAAPDLRQAIALTALVTFWGSLGPGPDPRHPRHPSISHT